MACSGSDGGDDEGKGEAHGSASEPDPSSGRGAAISREIRRHGADPDALIEVLHQVQLREGYLAAGALHQVARELRLPLSRVFGVASFYHLFRLTPPPRHRLALCHGTACFVNGAETLESLLRARFAVDDEGLWRAGASKPEASQAGLAVAAIETLREAPSRGASLSAPSPIGCPSAMAARSAERQAPSAMADGSALQSVARSRDGGHDDAGSEQGAPIPSDDPMGWRLERSGCLGACGHHPVLRLEDGPVLRLPLEPGVSLVGRLAALGVPLAPQLPALAP